MRLNGRKAGWTRRGFPRVAEMMAAVVAAAAAAPALAESKARGGEALRWDGKQPAAEYVKRAKLKPKETLHLGGGVTLEMLLTPAAMFTMGSPDREPKTDEHKGNETPHRVTSGEKGPEGPGTGDKRSSRGGAFTGQILVC